MGRYRNGHYYRGKTDGDLQWFEDGINMSAKMFFVGLGAMLLGIAQLVCWLFSINTSNNDRT